MSRGDDGPPGLTPAEAERLAILAEECAEVQQAVCKVLRHGYESRWPRAGGPTNREDLERELGHLAAAVKRAVWAGDVADDAIQAAYDEKQEEVRKWTHHQ